MFCGLPDGHQPRCHNIFRMAGRHAGEGAARQAARGADRKGGRDRMDAGVQVAAREHAIESGAPWPADT